jgi:hypothetical protein
MPRGAAPARPARRRGAADNLIDDKLFGRQAELAPLRGTE